MTSKIDPDEYMMSGWDSAPSQVSYRRGSLSNKVGMTALWTYYILFVSMIVRLIWVLNR